MTSYVAGKLPMTLAGKSYQRGEVLDAKAVRALKPASLQHLLDTGRITLIVDGAEQTPELAAAGVNVRAK
jgi:hypothetical protein